jgi:serine/threonine protein kinase
MELADQYKILNSLGNQSRRKFGKVYLIERRADGKLLVMKHVQLDATETQLIERAKREATFTFQLEGLPLVIEQIQTETEFALIKEYAPGIPLDEYWQSIPKKQRISELIRILHELESPFNALKENRIVHCDIKPSNIIIHKINDHIEVQLIDFGLAIRQNEENRFKLLFPLGFASPELLLNRLNCVNHTSDLFALGISIWKLFVGQLPLIHPNPSIFTNLQLTYPLPDHSNLPKGLYPILQKMCYKHQFITAPNRMNSNDMDVLLAEAKGKRYQSLSEVIQDLEQIPQKKSWWLI